MQWEYLTRTWSFIGPVDDDWPGVADYAARMEAQRARKEAEDERERGRDPLGGAMITYSYDPDEYDVLEGPEGEALIREYMRWRNLEELTYLNEFGAAGFELVAVTRHQSPVAHTIPSVDVFAYFKRPRLPDAPPLRRAPSASSCVEPRLRSRSGRRSSPCVASGGPWPTLPSSIDRPRFKGDGSLDAGWERFLRVMPAKPARRRRERPLNRGTTRGRAHR